MFSYYSKKILWNRMNADIEDIVGLPEIKQQLQEISHKIKEAELNTILGIRVDPPNPFHMVFLGNSGTGKSTVAEVLGKAFFLAGSLSTHSVMELDMYEADIEMINEAGGGILLMIVDEYKPKRTVVNALISIMDEGNTSVIFAGKQNHVNRLMRSNKQLYERLTITSMFHDLTFKNMAKILRSTVIDELDEACTVEEIEDILEREVSFEAMSMVNGHLIDHILIEAKSNWKRGMGDFDDRVKVRRTGDVDAPSDARVKVTLEDLEVGARVTQSNYHRGLLC